MKTIRWCAALAAGLTVALSSAEPVPVAPGQGAFGIRFGEVIPSRDLVFSSSNDYAFNNSMPPLPNALFSRYSVRCTPKTGKVFQIEASEDILDDIKASETRRALAEKLTGIYGKPLPFRTNDFAMKWRTNDVTITLSRMRSPFVNLEYRSDSVSRLAEAEHLELAKPHADSTGL